MNLTICQQAALSAYRRLQKSYPQLFEDRVLRPIVTDDATLELYAAQHEIALGLTSQTPYFLFVSDLVNPNNGVQPYVYSRVINVKQLQGGTNVAILATISNPSLGNLGDIILVEEERHATGRFEIGIPRGVGEPGFDGSSMALRELLEETGYSGPRATFLGESIIDSGSGDARVSFYQVEVDTYVLPQPEITEAIRNVHLISKSDLSKSIRAGQLADSFTLQALTLAALVP